MKFLQTTIGVIGAGAMGSGIAHVCAHAGMSVATPDVVEQRVAHRYARAAAALVPNEAVLAYSRGLASVEDIDKAMQLGCNHPDVLEGWAPA